MRLARLFSRDRLRARRPFRLTAAGWVFILYTVGVGAGAINTGNNLLYLIFGVFLGLIMASGALSDMSLWGLSAECIWPRSVPAGEPAMIPVRVRNGKSFLPSICISVEVEAELRGDTITARAYIPYIPAGGSVTVHAVFSPAERGWMQMRVLRFQTRYPFGLLRKMWTAVERPAFSGVVDRAKGLFVYPAPIASAGDERPPAATGTNPISPDARRGHGDNIYGLREYRETDNPRRIHWKASAKRSAATADIARAWLVRETEREQDSEVLLTLDAGVVAGMRAAERETAVRFGAGLIAAYAAEGHRVRLAVLTADGMTRRVASGDPESNDEFEFLALWNPDQPVDGTARYLTAPEPAGPARAIDVMAAYRGWRNQGPAGGKAA
jgi:uncharacterized protein (DUF58 family)